MIEEKKNIKIHPPEEGQTIGEVILTHQSSSL